MDQKIKVFRFGASTKGGQRANRKKTGVKVRHLASGIEVKVIETPFQAQNLKIALERLQEKLKKLRQRKKRRIPTRIPRGAKEKRLQAKKERSQKKKLRRMISY